MGLTGSCGRELRRRNLTGQGTRFRPAGRDRDRNRAACTLQATARPMQRAASSRSRDVGAYAYAYAYAPRWDRKGPACAAPEASWCLYLAAGQIGVGGGPDDQGNGGRLGIAWDQGWIGAMRGTRRFKRRSTCEAASDPRPWYVERNQIGRMTWRRGLDLISPSTYTSGLAMSWSDDFMRQAASRCRALAGWR